MSVTVSQYKCPNCGAPIPYDASVQKLKCQHCDTEFEISTLEAFNSEESIQTDNYGWDDYNTTNINIDGQITYVCPSCGGEVVGDKTMSAAPCPYCGSSVIIKDQLEGMLKPDLVVPFKYTKAQAKQAYADYLKNKKLLPKDFAINNIVEKINGLYLPYWLFDCDCSCQARYNATRYRRYIMGEYIIDETDHFLVYRDGSISFDKVPVDGSSKFSEELIESLEPFDFNEGKDFDSAYLAGYFSDRYDESAEKAIERANQRIKISTEQAVDSTVIGYHTLFKTSNNIRFSDGKIRYALLPIYVFSTKYNGKVYTFAMNGQTGKFSGNLPRDNKQTLKYAVVVFLITFVLVLAIMLLAVK